MLIIIKELLRLEGDDDMSDEKEERIIHEIKNRFDVGGRLRKLNTGLKKYNDEVDRKKNLDDTKAKLLRNIDIANDMFDKKGDIIFGDADLRLRAEVLYNNIKKYI